MSKPIPAINRYRADLREMQFLLFEQFKIEELLGKGAFEGWGADEIRSTLTEAYKWMREVVGPLNATADAEGCKLEDGQVKTPRGFKEAWTKLYEAGWKSIGVDSEYGGASSPTSVQILVEEMLSRREHRVQHVRGLDVRRGRGHRGLRHARAEARLLRAHVLAANGAARCASPSRKRAATSARRAPRRRATPTAPTRSPAPRSSSARGDHDLTENIVHLVLARIARSAGGHQGADAVHRAEVPRRRRRQHWSNQRRQRRRHRAQDGHQRRRRRACSTSARTASASACPSAAKRS